MISVLISVLALGLQPFPLNLQLPQTKINAKTDLVNGLLKNNPAELQPVTFHPDLINLHFLSNVLLVILSMWGIISKIDNC